jgi:two-component system, sensor histidine kinase PdtaS
MRLAKAAVEADFRRSPRRAVGREKQVPRLHVRTTAQLKNALAREDALLRERSDLLQRQATMAQEFEHRLLNSLQLIVSLLSLQSQTAPTNEAATQLKIAANRVAALGRVHRQLHLLDHQEKVEFKPYIEHLCEDLSDLLLQNGAKHAIMMEGANVEIPTALGIPLGFIVNELVTNSAKYARGTITVRLRTASAGNHSLSVSDDGPGLPAQFDPASSKGLGMKIIHSLVKQIGGELHIARAQDGHGACFTVTFDCPKPSASNSA